MLRKVLFSLALSTIFLPASEIVDWDFALSSGRDSPKATFTAVENRPNASVPHAYACGFFQESLFLPGVPNGLKAESEFDGVVARFSPDLTAGGWKATWTAQAHSKGDVIFNDLVLGEDTNLIYVAGSYREEVFFGDNTGVYLPNPGNGNIEGFVAKLHLLSGTWLDVYPMGDVIPQSVAIDSADSFYITGPGKLAIKFDDEGNYIWDVGAQGDTIEHHHIATRPAPNGEAFSYVLSTRLSSGDGRDVWLSALAPDGSPIWEKITASPSHDLAGGLGVSKQGYISFSVASSNQNIAYEGKRLAEPSNTNAQEVYVVRLRPDSSLVWSTRAAVADRSVSKMLSTDLAHDPRGNVHLAVNFEGPFTFEGRTRDGKGETGILSVGDGGVSYHFLESQGDAYATGRGVAAYSREEQVLVGDYQGNSDITFGYHTLPGDPGRLFAAFTKKIPGQSCFIVRQPENDNTPPAQFLANLKAVLQSEPGVTPQISTPAEIYREFNYPNVAIGPTGASLGVVGYAAFISLQDIDALESSGLYLVEEDFELFRSGTTSPAPYNLAKLNDSSASPPYSYTFPEMCQAVRFYLIDTAISDPGGNYFASNSKLTILDPVDGGYGELIRSDSDTAGIVTSEHGTNLLSLVVGPDEGVAPDTRITTKVYDIYPTLGTARASSLIDAILLALEDRLSIANELTPAVMLIASNTISPTSPEELPALEIALQACCDAQFPVVMSAGNNGALAADYAPAQFANRPCIICTGGSTEAGAFSGMSNSGAELKLVAPGENLTVATEFGGAKSTTLFSGTSGSAALAAGALLQFQSSNPWLRGSDLVNSFIAHCVHADTINHGTLNYKQVAASAARPPCVTGYLHWTSWFDLLDTSYEGNDDGDLYNNLQEYVFGFDPTEADHHPHGFGIDGYSPPMLEMGFPIAWWLWDTTATGPTYLLHDGATKLTVTSSTDLENFPPASVTLTPGAGCDFQSYLSFTIDTSLAAEKFFRIELKGM
ncbi:S8 family serine peptidase [Roseibacillus persicicus]|uniref:S8 family serine peptidase n=1 Tax=Roseibacillus persicicus TaxID=454148 RepID=UPI00280EB179|nr:S8 family serine peptidase [Roseibacillus persicicus]MDQ8191868.1 S8 family serine peptidase [Roseibacillus persicicus]